ncbi:MAG: tRNA 2-thiocytidine biosynthesis TtcA family protein [Desulfovermiculus sp.]
MKKNKHSQMQAVTSEQPRQPVLSTERPLSRGAKCNRCRGQAEVHLPSHHANFCPDCFLHFVRTAVTRGLKEIKFQPRPVMVAVSGGKDSLALWDLLHQLGYETRGLHIHLGISGFSEASSRAVAEFAADRGLDWSEYSLQEVFGYSIPDVHRLLRGKTCSLCGRLKRAFFNRLTVREGFATLATGHNLDDEAGRLLGNLVGKRLEHVHKQDPFLPSPHARIPAKLKPLFRLEIKELLAYCHLRGITPVDQSCSFSRGATSHTFKQALELLEQSMPGTKRSFLFSYLRDPELKARLAGAQIQENSAQKPDCEHDQADQHQKLQAENNIPEAKDEQQRDFGICQECGEPTYGRQCGICSLRDRLQEKEKAKKREGRNL